MPNLEKLKETAETLLSAVKDLTDDLWDRATAEELLEDWLSQSREALGRLPLRERIDLEELRRRTSEFFDG